MICTGEIRLYILVGAPSLEEQKQRQNKLDVNGDHNTCDKYNGNKENDLLICKTQRCVILCVVCVCAGGGGNGGGSGGDGDELICKK